MIDCDAHTGSRSRGRHARAVVAVLLVLAAACLAAARAQAAPGLEIGVTENAFRWNPAGSVLVARELGLAAFRVSLTWSPGQTELSAADRGEFDAMVTAATGVRIVVTVTGPARTPPLDVPQRRAYCAYVRSLLERYPTIEDVVIWNEPNLSYFWQPQFDPAGRSVAAAAYVALLGTCWDVLHALRPDVNVIISTSPRGNDNPRAASNISHSPGAFIRAMGAAYRASGRTAPAFDTVGHNPYGRSSAEPPGQRHLAPSHIAQADLDRLVDAFEEGFRGTPQPVPGRCVGAPSRCAAIWYLEVGYQTVPDAARRGDYRGRENDARPVLDAAVGASQASQLVDAIRLAYCQPYVGAFYNFLLWDEPDLARWQSGVLWVDGARKTSYEALRLVIDEVRRGATDCVRLETATPTAVVDPLVERIEWPALTAFSSLNEIWQFDIVARTDATYRAAVYRVGASTRTPSLRASGRLRARRPVLVRFPRQQLKAGSYVMEVVLSSTERPRLTGTFTSPVLAVE